MNLWLISQPVSNEYDTYDSAVVCASTIEEARRIHPGTGEPCSIYRVRDGKFHVQWSDEDLGEDWWREDSTWCKFSDVTVIMIGRADMGVKPGVVCSSYNAG